METLFNEVKIEKTTITFFRGKWDKGNYLLQLEWDKNPFESGVDDTFINFVCKKLHTQRKDYYGGLKYFLKEVSPKYLEAYENKVNGKTGPFTQEIIDAMEQLPKLINKYVLKQTRLKSGKIRIKIGEKFVYLSNKGKITQFFECPFDKDNIGLFKANLKTLMNREIWSQSCEEIEDKIK